MDDCEEQRKEQESWLIGCVTVLCECGNSDILLPDKHHPKCPYRVAAKSEPERWMLAS